jgi:hypothetical protein
MCCPLISPRPAILLFTYNIGFVRSNQMNVAFHRFNDGVHAARQYLFGHTQREAFGRVEGHVRRLCSVAHSLGLFVVRVLFG